MMTRQLNPQAKAITDCQSEIKALVNRMYLQGKPQIDIEREVRKIIKKYGVKLTNKQLRELMPKSMWSLYRSTMLVLFTAFGADGKKAHERMQVAQALISGKSVSPTVTSEVVGGGTEAPLLGQRQGIPNGIYAKDYMRKVNEVYTRLAKDDALDPDDISGRNSMRNRAEMEVRNDFHQDEIQSLKDKGAKLVVCSTHADCSDRCFKWQGRVYSLDGTSGKTADGHAYVPLETATDVYYTTKAGKTYKNGLLGFNCRHRLYEYVPGMGIPKVSKAEQKKENKINTRQREMERNIREWRMREDLNKAAGNTQATAEAQKKAAEAYARYKKYSLENGRAYYPDRVKI
nr:MAG TPA: minor capsid protein [Caudoviricetes sp.]